MRSLAVLEVREGEALTYKKKKGSINFLSSTVLYIAHVMTTHTICEIKNQRL